MQLLANSTRGQRATKVDGIKGTCRHVNETRSGHSKVLSSDEYWCDGGALYSDKY